MRPIRLVFSAVFAAVLLDGSAVFAAPTLPVLVPECAGKVTTGAPGAHTHTRLRVLVTAEATQGSAAQINTPTTIRAAYNLPATGGVGAIALVDAYHYPTALNDFNTFAAKYGLPAESSATVTAGSNVRFQVVYATGRKPASGGSYIGSWNLEEALDIEWAHAIAPLAKIYLVEAASDSTSDLLNAVEIASRLPGVHQVSMSWGTDESFNEAYFYDPVFTTFGVTYFAAGGDDANEAEYPSLSPNVISVGGTSLNRNNQGTLLSETVWNDTGCGLSRYEPRPAFQNGIAGIVGRHRGANDVAFNANPNTGVYVYDSTPHWGVAGWQVLGGTSASTPSWAAVANLASTRNGLAYSSQAENARLYAGIGDSANFRDITSGSAGYFSAGRGWDFTTGVGSPLGLGGK